MLKRRPNFTLKDIGHGVAYRDRRHSQNAQPTSQCSRHFHYGHHASNSPYHPRNNTPISSSKNSFSSHASLSLSDLPSVSSFTPSVSDDAPASEFSGSSRVTNIRPVSGRNLQRSYEDFHERECQVTEPRETMHGSNKMHDSRRGESVLRTDGRRVSLQNCPPITSYEPIGQHALWSPKEYWL